MLRVSALEGYNIEHTLSTKIYCVFIMLCEPFHNATQIFQILMVWGWGGEVGMRDKVGIYSDI